MRRTKAAAAAVVTAGLIALPVAGPALAAPAAPASDVTITCPEAGPELCGPLGQLQNRLGLLGDVLKMAGGSLNGLLPGLAPLTGLLSSGSIPAASLAQTTGALLTQLQGLSKPVVDLLRSLGLDLTALTNLLAEVQSQALAAISAVEAVVVPAPPAPAPAPAPGATPGGDGGAGGGAGAPAPGPGGSTGGETPTEAASGAPATELTQDGPVSRGGYVVPRMPVGGTLELVPLGGVPQLDLGTDGDLPAAASVTDIAAAAVPDVLDSETVIAPATPAAVPAADDADTSAKATAAILALGMLAFAAGLLIDQVRKARQPFQIS